MISDLVKLAAQYGLSTVLLFIVGWAYDRQQKKNESERAALVGKHEAERAKWEEERRGYFESSREDGEKIQGILLKVQEHSATVINKASDMASAFEQEKREIRDAREREIRDTSTRAFPPGRNR